jgi:hypothetical protein
VKREGGINRTFHGGRSIFVCEAPKQMLGQQTGELIPGVKIVEPRLCMPLQWRRTHQCGYRAVTVIDRSFSFFVKVSVPPEYRGSVSTDQLVATGMRL